MEWEGTSAATMVGSLVSYSHAYSDAIDEADNLDAGCTNTSIATTFFAYNNKHSSLSP